MKVMTGGKTISSRRYLIFILSICVIPTICCLLFYNYYSIRTLNRHVAQTGQNMISLYQSQLKYELDDISLTIADYWANDYDHINMLHKVDELKRHESGYEIGLKYRTLISNNNSLGAIAVVSIKNKLMRFIYKEGEYTMKEQDEISDVTEGLLKNVDKHVSDGWQPYVIGKKTMLFRIIGYNGGYTILMVDLARTLPEQVKNVRAEDGFLYFGTKAGNDISGSGTVLGKDAGSDKIGDDYYITHGSTKYLVVNQYSDTFNTRIFYFIPYKSSFAFMNWVQMMFLILSVLLIMLIPIGYILISKSYLEPMNRLMGTMRSIRDGNIDEKAVSNYKIREFQEFSDTFNQMMIEIKDLKIESCERELQMNRAELQYLQLQIKPHFFLNCLKNLYGMAELKRFDRMQDMILQISSYLRYFFKDNMSMVTVKDELAFVENYVALQKYSMEQDIDCDINVEDGLAECIIPVLLIQPFVENSFKYGRIDNQSLDIRIRIVELQTESGPLLDICVSDNGKGFDPAVLGQLNDQSPHQYSEHNVGLNNIRQRLFLIYGGAAMIQFNNADESHGSICEVIVPARK